MLGLPVSGIDALIGSSVVNDGIASVYIYIVILSFISSIALISSVKADLFTTVKVAPVVVKTRKPRTVKSTTETPKVDIVKVDLKPTKMTPTK